MPPRDPSVGDPSRRDDRDPLSDRVDDLGHEGQGGDEAGVAPRLGSLGHDDVTSGVHGAARAVDLPAHVDDQKPVTVAQVEHVGGDAESGDEHRGAAFDDLLHLLAHVPGHGGQQVDAEGLARELAHAANLLDHHRYRHRGSAEAPEPTGFRHRRDEAVIGDASHSGEHDGVLDPEDLGESRTHPASALCPTGRGLSHGR